MIGLVWKDLLVLRKTIRAYALFLCFYLAMTLMGAFDVTFITSILQVVLLMLPLSAFAYDDQAKWNRYALTLPLTPQTLVGGRYLFALLISLAAFALALAVTAASVLLHQAEPAVVMASTLVSLGVGLCIVAIMLPLCYQMGPERARPYLFAIVFLPVLALFLLSRAGLAPDLAGLDTLSIPTVLGLSALVPLAALAGLGVSFLISCRIVVGKEY